MRTHSLDIPISLSPRRITQALILVVLCLTFASVAGHFLKHVLSYDTLFGWLVLNLAPFFDLNGETNIPTWYSSSALLLCSILLAIIASTTNKNNARYVLHWRALSVIFLGMSMDEVVQLHELADAPMRSILHAGDFFFHAWTVLGIAFVLILGLAYLRFLAYLPAKTRGLFLVAGTVYCIGAIGMELANQSPWMVMVVMIETVEESLEMLGVVIFIYALMSYLGSLGDAAHTRSGDRAVD